MNEIGEVVFVDIFDGTLSLFFFLSTRKQRYELQLKI
jgi:hypothetical protein